MSDHRDTVPEAGVIRVLTESAEGVVQDYNDRRLSKLEEQAVDCERKWYGLQGVNGDNGRLSHLDRAIANLRGEVVAVNAAIRLDMAKADAELREDIGTPEERKAERAAAARVNGFTLRTKVLVGGLISFLFGGGGYAIYRSHAASIDEGARRAEWRRQVDVDINRLYEFCRAPRPDPTRGADP